MLPFHHKDGVSVKSMSPLRQGEEAEPFLEEEMQAKPRWTSKKIRMYFAPIFTILNFPVALWTFRIFFHLLSRMPSFNHSISKGFLLISFSATHAATLLLQIILCIWELVLDRDFERNLKEWNDPRLQRIQRLKE